MSIRLLLVTSCVFGLLAVGSARAQPSPRDAAADPLSGPAPTGDHPPPRDYFLLRLAGDRTEIRYAPGALDRAANLQTRLEMTARFYRKWTKIEIAPHIFVLTHDNWREAGYGVAYGLPIRIGAQGLAVPALGDDETVALWTALLDGHLPVVDGFLFRGTAQEAASLVLADVLVQRAAGEMLVDRMDIRFEQPWMRELAVHLVTQAVQARIEPGRVPVLDALYLMLAQRHLPGTESVRDYRPDLPLADWLWFESQFHVGARLVVARAGDKDAVKALRSLVKKGGGSLTLDGLLRRFEDLRDWLHQSFTAVSRRTDSR